jgi:hypothetical protein
MKTCNVGGADKALRLNIGIIALATAMFAPLDRVKRGVAFAVAAVSVTTALTGFCPLNELLDIDTCHRRNGKTLL